MNCLLIGSAVATTLAGLVIHIVWWRVRRPADDVLALAVVMGAIPLLLSTILNLLVRPGGEASALSPFDHVVQWGALAILHLFFALVYMSCYTAAQAASPTVLIVLLSRQAPQGVTRDEIEKHLTEELVCGNLVQAAIHEKFLTAGNGRLTIGGRGRFLLGLGRTARKLAGLSAPTG